MSEKPSEISEFLWQGRMYATAEDIRKEMMGVVQAIAGARQAGDSIKTLIVRASMRAMMPVSKIKRYWYGEVNMIPAHEADHLRVIAAKTASDRRSQLQTELDELKRKLNEWQ